MHLDRATCDRGPGTSIPAAFTANGPTTVSKPQTSISGTVTLSMDGAIRRRFRAPATSSRGSGRVYSYDSITDTFLSN